jgi:hypothetical protein
MMQLAAQQQRFWLGMQLCGLPAAHQLSSRELCEVIVSVLEHADDVTGAGTDRLIRQLLTLPAAQQQLPQGSAKQLLQRLIDTCPVWPAGVICTRLAALQLGSQLTGGEVLQLLQQAASNGAKELLRFIAQLKPAADEIDDAEGFAAVLQAAYEKCDDDELIDNELRQLPIVQLMQPDDVLSVIRSGIMSKREYTGVNGEPQCVFRFVLHHPAVAKLSAASLEQLLLDAAQHKRLEHVAALLRAPAALQLPVGTVEALLQHAVKCAVVPDEDEDEDGNSTHSSCCELLLALPAVQQLPAAAVASILAAAVDAGNAAAVRRICAVDAAAEISNAAASSLLQLAASKHCTTWFAVLQGLPQLAELPADQLQLTRQQLQQLLGEAIAAGDDAAVSKLCEYAAAACRAAAAAAEPAGAAGITAQASIHPLDMLPLALAAVQHLGDYTYNSLEASTAAQLFQLDAARALGPSAVVKLLSACVANRAPEGVLLVALLPAASQLDQQACEDLVAEAVQHVKPAETLYDEISRQANIDVLRNLLQQPAVQQLDAAAAVRLMSACLKLKLKPAGTAAKVNPSHPLLLLQQLHSELPGAQQAALESESVKQLMHTAFKAREWAAFDWLKTLPVAPVNDEKVRVWCSVRAVEHMK